MLSIEELALVEPLCQSKILTGWNEKNRLVSRISTTHSTSEYTLVLCSPTTIDTALSTLHHDTISGLVIVDENESLNLVLLEQKLHELTKPVLYLTKLTVEDVILQLNQILLLKQNHLFTIALDQGKNYWLSQYQQKDLLQWLPRLQQFLSVPISIFNQRNEQFNFSTEQWMDNQLFTDYTLNMATNFQTFAETEQQTEQNYKVFPIHSNNEALGFLIVELSAINLSFSQLTWIGHLLQPLQLWLKQEQSNLAIHRKYKHQFLYDLLMNNIETESDLMEMARLWDLKLMVNPQVATIDFHTSCNISSTLVDQLEAVIQRLAKQYRLPIMMMQFNQQLVCILFEPISTEHTRKEQTIAFFTRMFEQLKTKFPELVLAVGIGRIYSSNLEAYRSFQESRIALKMNEEVDATSSITHYDDLGFMRLLSYIHDDLLIDFADQHINKLIKHDIDNQSDLIHTLYTYYKNSGDIGQTAHELFIHQNTLRHRIKKIQSILDLELNSYMNIVNLMISLKICKDIYRL